MAQHDAPSPAFEGEIRQLFREMETELSRRGPSAWLDYFEDGPSFSMASEGELRFADIGEARAMIHEFAPRVSELEMAWSGLRIEPLTPRLVHVAAAYNEVLVMISGERQELAGYFTGVIVRSAHGWRLRKLHWSSPLSTP